MTGLREAILKANAAVKAADIPMARDVLARAVRMQSLEHDHRKEVGIAFEHDMEPVTNAIVSALQSGDMAAFRGLRAMLPQLLSEVNASPELADAFSLVLGRSLVSGVFGKEQS